MGEYVGKQSENLVILCSKEIFMRPWCCGEMFFAMENEISTMRTVFPDFTQLDEDLVANYGEHVPTLAQLSQYGLSVANVQQALRWAIDRPEITLPRQLNNAVT